MMLIWVGTVFFYRVFAMIPWALACAAVCFLFLCFGAGVQNMMSSISISCPYLDVKGRMVDKTIFTRLWLMKVLTLHPAVCSRWRDGYLWMGLDALHT
jgi:hypothetical protein